MTEQFISEPLTPRPGCFDIGAMSRGEPGLPAQFVWRDQLHTVTQVVSRWKSSSSDRGEVYLRRHWFRIVTDAGAEMTLYCQRQAGKGKNPKARWWIFTLHEKTR